MNSQMNYQPDTTFASDQRTTQGTWPPPVASVTPSASGEWEQENARLRLALREAQHRSGNQWQLLLGLAELESGQSATTSTMGGNVRLRAMMTAFATLNRALETDAETLTGHQKVRVRVALESVLATLQAATGEHALSFAVQEAWLPEKACAALLLACAELVCNAIKHGKTTTQVTFGVQGGQGVLSVQDDGPGFPAGFRVEAQEGQGLQLVQTLCRFDLGGEMHCHSDAEGGLVILTFPVFSAPEAAVACAPEAAAVEANETSAEADKHFCEMEGILCPADL